MSGEAVVSQKNGGFEAYLKIKDYDLIQIIGEKLWREEKIYFIEEILQMVQDWQSGNQKPF